MHPTPQLLPDGSPAAAVSLPDPGGTERQVLPSAQHRPVVLWFVESACATCRAEAPTLCGVARTRPDLVVTAVVSGGRNAAAAQSLSSALAGCGVHVLLDPQLEATHAYAVSAVPTVYVVDSGGNISYGGLGPSGVGALTGHLPGRT